MTIWPNGWSRSSSASTPTCTPTPPPWSMPAPAASSARSPCEADPDGYAELQACADQHARAARHGRSRAPAATAPAWPDTWPARERAGDRAGPAGTRPTRRNGAKSDPLDAIRAAREALARPRLGTPRSGGDRAGAVGAAGRPPLRGRGRHRRPTPAVSLVITAPEPVRARFRGQSYPRCSRTAAALRVQPVLGHRDDHHASPCCASLARRARTLTPEAAEHEKAILGIVRSWRPDLLDQPGVGPIVAATVLCAWSHPGRFRSEAAFAMLAGAAPIPATSGQVTTRTGSTAPATDSSTAPCTPIVLSRLRYDPAPAPTPTAARAEGKTDREIRRCLKRYIARQLYRQLEHHPSPLDDP